MNKLVTRNSLFDSLFDDMAPESCRNVPFMVMRYQLLLKIKIDISRKRRHLLC